MTDAEFHSYRFNDETDPTDEQLAELMRRAAAYARESNEIANKRFLKPFIIDAKKRKMRSLPYSK